MEAAHIHLVRVGEFAWSAMEPSEGKYDFAWLDHAIELAAKHHICVVLGTPTAAPPAWLTTKYPDTLRIDEKGIRDEHGNRQQFSFASARYRKFAHEIAEKMAERYGHNPNVVGWQLDNEYAALSFDPEAKAQFHAWLKAKYGTIANLNDRWTTAYWSQTYDNFDEIPVRQEEENPGLLLDWKHFVSDTWKSYSENQISAIRPHADKRQFITTNTMGWFDGFDEYVVHSNLDMAAWDDYVGGNYDYIDNGARHDLTRGFKNKNFWVMETQPAFVNWQRVNAAVDRGQVRDMAWQAIGHGADAVEYWQWRSALNGQEQYHGVLVGADGTPVPVYDEVKQVGDEFEKAGKALAGTSPQSSVALINDYDSRWAINFQRHNRNFDPVEEMVAFYKPLRNQAQGVDVISAHASLDKYKLVVAPGLNVLPKETADHLLDYVKQGGNLVLGPRSGMKDEYNALHVERQPGPLVDALGGRVEQFYALDNKVPVSGDLGSGTASLWAEQLSTKSPDTRVLLRYGASNGWLDNQPAVITRKVGKGSITYIGAWLDDNLLAKITASLLQQSGVQPIVPNAPEGVEVCLRSGTNKSVLILINHNTAEAHIELASAMNDLFDNTSRTSVDLPKYGVAVLEAK
jgi:beta-galactosidase